MIKSREIVVDTIFAERSPKKANESLEATSQSKIKIRGNFFIKLFGPKNGSFNYHFFFKPSNSSLYRILDLFHDLMTL